MNHFYRLSLILFCLFSFTANAAWFEASGQAVVMNGNKQLARQQATQEAIKQALLFAGASVHSVQKMANGLLQDDHFEVRANGDVNNVELVSEHQKGDVLTVIIRADIFASQQQCDAANYQKSVVTSWFPIRYQQQALEGGLQDMGQQVAERLQQTFQGYAKHSRIKRITPFYTVQQDQTMTNAIELATRQNSQYVLFGEITQLSVDPSSGSGWKFWQTRHPLRHFALHIKLFNGTTGELLMDKIFKQQAIWPFPFNQTVSADTELFWSSPYGKQIQQTLQDIAGQIDDRLSCQPAYGRVLRVQGENISVNLGSKDGLQQGDHLRLFQLSQFYDQDGHQHYQYRINPVKISAKQVFSDNAIVVGDGSQPLMNIQPNDFVMAR